MIEGMEPNNTTDADVAPIADDKKKKPAADSTPTTTTASANTTTTTKPPGSEPPLTSEEFSMEKVASGSTKENLSNLSPAPVGSEGNSMLDLQKGMASGYGAQKEQAYKALASLGGAGAAGANSNMSSEALSQQSEMINNLKSIQPILDTAEKFLDKFENSSISKMFSNMGSIPGMSLLTGGLGKTASPAVPVGAQA